MLAQQAAHDLHKQPLAGHELLQGPMGADGLDGVLPQTGLARSDFVAGPGIMSFKFAGGSQDYQLAVGFAKGRVFPVVVLSRR